MKKTLLLSMVTASLLVADSIENLEKQLTTQQTTIDKLEQQISKLEKVTKPKPKSTQTSSFGQKAFIPDISLIGDFSYVNRTNDTEHSTMPGLTSHSHGAGGHSHAGLNANEGFNLNYAEMVLQSSVDPYLDLTSVFHLGQDSFEIEELYATSRGLPNGLGLKVGKFFSNFGRLNSKHHHQWSFADQALINKAFLSEEGLNEIGLALNWVAPTPFYLDFGLEVLKGSNESSYGDAAIELTEDVGIAKTDAPNLKVLYAKAGTDIGDTALLAGLSYADGDARLNHLSDEEAHAFAGSSKLYGVDLTLQKPLGSYSSLTWTTEYMQRKLDGTEYVPNTAKDAWANQNAVTQDQAGIYSSLVYKMDNEWRMGLRYDDILKNDVIENGSNKNLSDDMNRYSAMVEYNFSEFNRLRLQYNRDNAKFTEAGTKIKNNEIILQLNMSIGSHGAHAF